MTEIGLNSSESPRAAGLRLATSGPDRTEVAAALRRVLASESFRTAPQLCAFLSFVVERTREGRAAEIKGYTIATEALGRPASFDPQADPIVRVEAMRLRRALDAYYAGAGAGDPLRIVLPRGGYVPSFVRPEAEAPVMPPPVPAVLPRSRRIQFALAAALVAVLVLAGALFQTLRPAAPPAFALIPVPGLALVEVTGPSGNGGPARRIASRMAEWLARFEEIDVVDLTQGSSPQRRTIEAPSLRYVLSVSESGAADGDRVALRLTYGPTGQLVWNADLPAGAEAETAEIAAQIGQPYGVIFADLRGREGIHRNARCLIDAYDYRNAPSPASHAAARDCLEAMDTAGNALAAVRFLLTRLYIDEERRGFNRRPDPLGRALAAADSAVRAAPGSARARHALMNALFAMRDVERAVAVGLEAHQINPNDSITLSDLGMILIATTRYREGQDLLDRAVALNPAGPLAADLYRFVAAHMQGDADTARIAAARFAQTGTTMSLVAQIAVAGEPDDRVNALIQRLAETAPDFVKTPKMALERLNFAPEIAERLAADLRHAGLVTAASSAGGKPASVPQ